MSSSAPFATTENPTGSDPQKGGRKKFDVSNDRTTPFATEYPDAASDTPKKHAGRRRYGDQDAAREAPFATNNGQQMFQTPPPASDPPVNNKSQSGGRQKPIKPSDNSDVFRYDGSSAGDTPARGGKRMFQQEKHEAPFATVPGPDERNGTETPRSAGGRRRFDDKLQKNPAPFALDDGERFKNVPAKTNTNRAYGNDCPFARD